MNYPSPLAGEGDSPQGERGEGGTALRHYARAMRREPTEAERKLWVLLRDRCFSTFKFRRQVPIGPFIADFLCYQARLIIEADGSQHIESTTDDRRLDWLEGQGFRVLRFWNSEITSQSRDVMERVYLALTYPLTPLGYAESPSPARGEGKEQS